MMRVWQGREGCEVRIGDRETEQPDATKYLGEMTSSDWNCGEEVGREGERC